MNEKARQESIPERLGQIAEGKTKIIWETTDPGLVIIESKDIITAGDGQRRSSAQRKGRLSTETTSNCFSLLSKEGIPNHFVDRLDENTFLAKRLKMIPLESVARRIAFGSYLKRHPEVEKESYLEDVAHEFFFKDDIREDPLILYNQEEKRWYLYDAHRPSGEGFMERRVNAGFLNLREDEIAYLESTTKLVFETLEKAWASQNITLVDLKIEFGFDKSGNILVGDVIDNDSWRIWPEGDASKMLDKQVFRNMEVVTSGGLNSLMDNYEIVADLTSNFVSQP